MADALGRKIRSARELRGMTVTDLANATGRSKSYLSDLENGNSKRPGTQVIMDIAKALSVDPVLLLHEDIESVMSVMDQGDLDLPEDVRTFLLTRDALPWVQLAKDCQLADITPEDARDILEVLIRRVRKGQ